MPPRRALWRRERLRRASLEALVGTAARVRSDASDGSDERDDFEMAAEHDTLSSTCSARRSPSLDDHPCSQLAGPHQRCVCTARQTSRWWRQQRLRAHTLVGA